MSRFMREATVHLGDRLGHYAVIAIPVSYQKAYIEETLLCDDLEGARCLHLFIRDQATDKDDPLDPKYHIAVEMVLRERMHTDIPPSCNKLIRIVSTKDGRYRWFVFLRKEGLPLPEGALFSPETCTRPGAPPGLRRASELTVTASTPPSKRAFQPQGEEQTEEALPRAAPGASQRPGA